MRSDRYFCCGKGCDNPYFSIDIKGNRKLVHREFPKKMKNSDIGNNSRVLVIV